MEVVKANIERIGGSIALHSTAGRGTLFTIRIPLTLAIISAFILEACGERFALPQACVVELVRIGAEDALASGQSSPVLERVDGAPMLRLRDQLLPLIHLGAVLRLDGPVRGTPGSIIVVLSVNGVTLGLVVDRVFDTEEIVVKPVAPVLRHITMFGGTTILGDGSVVLILEPNGIARSLALGDRALRPALAAPTPETAERSGDLSAMLLFRGTADSTPSAVPLALVARIEDMGLDQIEISAGRPVVQYRGALMPLAVMEPLPADPAGTRTVLVFTDRGRSMGLVVHEVVDVVEEKLVIELSAARPELLGTAVIAGRVTDVIDAGYWLIQAWRDWFHHEGGATRPRKRLLVVEDSSFFRQLLVPMLAASGYDVTAVDSAARAIALRDTTQTMFDAIISDVEMPGMDGLEFAKRLREDGPWRYTPLLALSGRLAEADAERGRAAGFSEYVGKLDRETLLAALDRCMALAELRIA
jgi:two-component system chemotaxis sensor kinase CheA